MKASRRDDVLDTEYEALKKVALDYRRAFKEGGDNE
jgi:hypothetical protein